ncbi:MAG TPA: winged helix-turn-helix domain-containing protein [Acetobacteraceae bacterium]|nr:winged helix-turn-helix domain-containing protein [Acetobacteraceae bacterium]
MRYLFGNQVLDTERRELRRGGAIVPVTPQVYALLSYLIRNRDRVVGKDDLVAAIWSGRSITDTAMTTRINAVRRAIGDNGDAQRLIRTLTRRGYRFVGLVREERDSEAAAVLANAPDSAKSGSAGPGNPTVAVLPFANMSRCRDHDFFADTMAANAAMELTKWRWLHVIARVSRHAARDDTADVRRLGTDLGARYVLEGTVSDAGRGIRVTAMLIDTGTGVLAWAGRFGSARAPRHDVRDEIAAMLACNVAGAIGTAERQRAMRASADQLGGWEAYQRGMWHMSNCEPAENALAQRFFRRAIDLDPAFAAGYSAMGWSYLMAASIFSHMTIPEGCELAEPLLRKATALDQDDVDSRVRLAIGSLLRGDLEAAFECAQKALSFNENCAEALGVKGTALLYSDRRQEGRDAIERHLRLSPRDPARPIRLSQVAASLYLDGNYADAMTTAQRVVWQYPRHPTAYRWLAASLGQLGRSAEAAAALEHLQTIAPASFDMYVRQRPQYCSIEHAPLVEGMRKAGWKE